MGLIELAKNHNYAYRDDGSTYDNKRVNVRRGGGPQNPDYYNDNILTEDGYEFLDDIKNEYWTGSFVVPNSKNSNIDGPDSYKGGKTTDIIKNNENYNVKLYYYNGRVKAIYIGVPDEDEKAAFNEKFEEYQGEQRGSSVKNLIKMALENNEEYSSDINKRVNVRRGGGPSKDDYFEDKNNAVLSKDGNDTLNDSNNRAGSYVYPTPDDNGAYTGGLSIDEIEENGTYTVKCFYYDGRVKAIYVKKNN